jgi:hypothetical protein
MRAKRITAGCVIFWFAANCVHSQSLKNLATPQPLPEGSTLVIGFLGGFDRWNDPERGVRKVALDLRSQALDRVFVETIGNHQRLMALKFIRRTLDANRNGRIDPDEAASARIVLYGQSLGGWAVVKTARDLERWGVPVLLTVQIDSVGLNDGIIPPNVLAAANFFQHDPLSVRGQTEIRAADPTRTRILGNYRFTYLFRPIDEPTSWRRRTFGRSHAKMELDPIVWNQVEELILDAIRK